MFFSVYNPLQYFQVMICVKLRNIGPFSSGNESVVLERDGLQNLKEKNLFIKTENNLVMILCVIYFTLTIP